MIPTLKHSSGELWMGDCLDLMASIPDGSVDMVVTSPPYDDLRTYNGSLVDWNFNKFALIACQLVRIIKRGSVIVWNVSDATIDGSETGSSFRQALHFISLGLRLHDTMIWKKSNFSNPSNSRYHQTFEYMFVFSKGKPSVFHGIKDRKNVYAGKVGSLGLNTVSQRDGSKKIRKSKVNADFGMRHNVWEMNTSGQNREKSNHPATFPIQLAHDHIISWSDPGQIVLDPFCGSGTTAVAAHNTGRRWLCIERDPAYYLGAVQRILSECAL